MALIIFSLGVAGYAVGVYGFLPLGVAVHPDVRANFEAHRTGVYAHVFASAVALTLGPFQFSARLRAARLGLHRWLGRLYLGVGVLVGGVAGVSYELACAVIAWLCWVPNLLAAQLLLRLKGPPTCKTPLLSH